MDEYMETALASMPRPARKYQRRLDRLTENQFNAIIGYAERMLAEASGEDRYDAIHVAVVAHLIFGVGNQFTERQLRKACMDEGVHLVARSVVDLAASGLRL